MSEMSYARHLIKGDKVERSHLKRAENEQCFGETTVRRMRNLQCEFATHATYASAPSSKCCGT